MPLRDRQKRLQYHRKYNKHHYEANKDKRKWQVRQRRQKIKAWWREYKATMVCTDCGFEGKNNIWAMEHDHINPSNKSRVVSRMVSEGRSIDSIKKEIAKCEPVCANCHRKREHIRMMERGDNTSDRSREPAALSDQIRRRNARKRNKRDKLKEEYAGKRRPGPAPQPLPSIKQADVAKRYEEYDAAQEKVD